MGCFHEEDLTEVILTALLHLLNILVLSSLSSTLHQLKQPSITEKPLSEAQLAEISSQVQRYLEGSLEEISVRTWQRIQLLVLQLLYRSSAWGLKPSHFLSAWLLLTDHKYQAGPGSVCPVQACCAVSSVYYYNMQLHSNDSDWIWNCVYSWVVIIVIQHVDVCVWAGNRSRRWRLSVAGPTTWCRKVQVLTQLLWRPVVNIWLTVRGITWNWRLFASCARDSLCIEQSIVTELIWCCSVTF